MGVISYVIFPVIFAILGYALILLPEQYFYVGFHTTPQPQGSADPTPIPDPKQDGIYRETVTFDSNGTKCEGWLYIPIKDISLRNKHGFPVIAMAHGIGSTRDMGLYRFAQKFARNGIAVLLFDYRHFGTSNGEPRHLLSPSNLVNDYHNAIKYLKYSGNNNKKYEIDSNRIGLWGTSYAGGHVIVTGSQDSTIKAIISQMPFMGPLPTESKLNEYQKRGIKNVLIGVCGAISDIIRSKLNSIFGTKFSPLYSRIYGSKTDNVNVVALNYWENFNGKESEWLSKHPKDRPNDWRNAVLLRSLFEMGSYRPLLHSKGISKDTSVLYIIANGDLLCPVDRIELANEWTKTSQVYRYDISHFGMYSGKPFDDVSDVQIEFFRKHLATN